MTDSERVLDNAPVTYQCTGCKSNHPKAEIASQCCPSGESAALDWDALKGQTINLDEATLEELVRQLAASVNATIEPDGSGTVDVLGRLAVFSEIRVRGSEKEAARLIVEASGVPLDELDGLDDDIKDWLTEGDG